MDKVCINCKWWYKATCNCKELNITATTKDDGVKYVEDGLLSTNIEESGLTKDIIKIIIVELKEQDYIKKTKNINNFNEENIEKELIEVIDDKLSEGIMNYFDGECDEIKINNPSELSCCYWE
jgi:hypothetical protein